MFTRSIRTCSENPCDSPRTWSSPSPPKWQTWNNYHLRDGGRLHYVKLGGEIKGIIACFLSGYNAGVYGFTDTSKPFQTFLDPLRELTNKNALYWMYFPINTNEVIKDAWVMKGDALNPSLAVSPILFRFPFSKTHRDRSELLWEEQSLLGFTLPPNCVIPLSFTPW